VTDGEIHAAIEAWAQERESQPAESRRHPTPEDDADDALDFIARAASAENDPGLRRLLSETMGLKGAIPPYYLGSLHSRLEWLGATPERLREMGAAFVDAGLKEDAIQYLWRLWRSSIYVRDIRFESGITVCDVRSDVAEVICELPCIPDYTSGFANRALPRCSIPPPERDANDERRTKRILGEWLNKDGVTIYKSRVDRDHPCVTATDEREWEMDLRNRFEQMIARNRKLLGPPRRIDRAATRAAGELQQTCRTCQRFTPDCRLFLPNGHRQPTFGVIDRELVNGNAKRAATVSGVKIVARI